MKRFFSFLLCLCLLVPVLPARAEGAPPDWAARAYEVLESRDILTSPRASGSITRGDFAKLLVRVVEGIASSQELAQYPPKEAGYFADSSDTMLLKAAAYGILDGAPKDGLLYANSADNLTREQAAKMVCSVLDFASQKLSRQVEPSASPAVYTDTAAISPWAVPYTKTIASYKLMVGDEHANFSPKAELEWPAAVVLTEGTLALLDGTKAQSFTTLSLQSGQNWSGASRFGAGDYSVSRPKTGWAGNYYTISNGDGTVSGLVVGESNFTVERFDQAGALASTKTLDKELPIFGAFFDSGAHFYIAFGANNPSNSDSQEVFRIVQYDRSWNRLGSVSVNGGDAYTSEPFRATVSRMAVSGDGKSVALYAARKRYDGHQSNITIIMNTAPFSVQRIMGDAFPSNHVSHSFGQFVQYDGSRMVTVDHGDAYPRSFVFQDGSREIDLLKIYGDIGENVTNAIGSGFEVSEDGYLFLGCSDPQDGSDGKPWNVFLSYIGRSGNQASLSWLTHSGSTINCARLVKLSGDTFAAMWQDGKDIHVQKLNGKGQPTGQEQVVPNITMPSTQPVVINGAVCWIQSSSAKAPVLYRVSIQ